MHQQRAVRRQAFHALRHVGHVERAGQAVQQAHRDEEQRRAGEVEAHVVQRGAQPRHAGPVQQQAVGRDQQHLEEHEQVEEVAGQERAVDAHQLELEQRVEVRAAAVVATAGVQQRDQRDTRGQREHQRRQTVEHQHDAVRRLPVGEQVGLDAAAVGLQQQRDRQREQGGRGGDAGARRQRGCAAGGQQQQRARDERQHDRHDDPVRHRRHPRRVPPARARGSPAVDGALGRASFTSFPRPARARRLRRGPSRSRRAWRAR